jgi:hypothetical protein
MKTADCKKGLAGVVVIFESVEISDNAVINFSSKWCV